MGRRNLPPRILKLLQEQPPLFAKKGECLPPRLLKLQHEHRRVVPPRILKLQQQQNPVPPRMLRLQEDKLRLLETHDSEDQQQEDIFPPSQALEDQPQDFLGRQEDWIEVGMQFFLEQLLERQLLEVEIDQTWANPVSEPIIDYKRLTSFLEDDYSFLTPWKFWNRPNHTSGLPNSESKRKGKGTFRF